jgi:hypothetical protein
MCQFANDMATEERTYLLKVQSKYVSVRSKVSYKIQMNSPAEYGEQYSRIKLSV